MRLKERSTESIGSTALPSSARDSCFVTDIHRPGRTRTCNPRFWRPVLYHLSYAPRFAPGSVGMIAAVPLFALFTVLTLAFGGIAGAWAAAGRWVIAVAAGAIAAWMGSFALAALRRTRR